MTEKKDSKLIPSPSEEQLDIVNSVIDNKSIFVDAVAGSGKTTTICHIGLNILNKNILVVTYNNHLKIEVREKVLKMKLNIEVHTYHSLGYKYYSESCFDDSNLEKILIKDLDLKYKKNFDIIIIDETQDMTPSYFKLIIKFMNDNNFNKQIITFGDKHQCIYRFKGADSRFLTLSHIIYKNISKHEFVNKTLKESYRLTKQMAWFVNDIMMNEKRIISNKEGPKVEYIVSNSFAAINKIFEEILILIKKGFKYDDIFILSPSVKKYTNGGTTPLNKLENNLVNANIPCFVPMNDNAKIDGDMVKGKIVFTTFHQSKGRERKIVILFNFDNSYFKYYNKDDDPKVCPSILYVAATRASYKLYVLEDPSKERFKFIKENKSYDYMELSGNVNIKKNNKKIIINNNNQYNEDIKISINEIIKYLKQDIINIINDKIKQIFIKINDENEEDTIPIPYKINTDDEKDLYEEVSDINILTILSMWETKYTDNTQILTNLMKNNDTTEYGKYIEKININNLKLKDYMLIANIYNSIETKYMFKLAQIKEYNWLNNEIIKLCIDRIENKIDYNSDDIEIGGKLTIDGIKGVPDTYFINNEYKKLEYIGNLYLSTNNTIWELVCSDNTTFEHFLKIIVKYYVYNILINRKIVNKKTFKILNIKTNELYKIDDTKIIEIEDIIKLLLENKFGKNEILSNEEFISRYTVKTY